MPVYRTPDGRIVEEKTARPPLSGRKAPRPESGAEDTTVRRTDGSLPPAPPPPRDGYDAPTVVRLPGGSPSAADPAPRADTERTQLHGAIGRGTTGEGAEVVAETDPVAGWLVVVEGPGAGRDLRIGVGRNEMGRDPQNRMALAFGDRRISRRAHLWVTYDNVNRVFSVAPGTSANLAYLNGAAVEQRSVLTAGDTIRVGRTTLRFVAFCGDDFNWADED